MSGGHIVVIKRTGLDGSRFPLLSGSVTVGKGQDCDIRVLLNTVSDEQCIITVNKNQSVIKNLSSSYLTVVNGEPIQMRALEDGDVITVGDRSLRWEYLVKPPAQKVQMAKITDKVKVSRKKLGTIVSQGRRSEGAAKRVDAQIKKMLDIKSRNSIANMPSMINTRQIAVVKPQRRSLDLTNKEQGDDPSGDAPGTPSRRRKEAAAGVTVQSKRAPINNKSEKKADLNPKLVTKPHRGKLTRPAQRNVTRTPNSGKGDVANTNSTPINVSTRGSAKKNKNESIPKARTTPAKVVNKNSVPDSTPAKRNVVTKIQAPVTMDENKKAALMILTGRSPIKKNIVTPNKKTAKAELPAKYLLGKLESGRNSPRYAVPKKSPAKYVASTSKSSSKLSHKPTGSVKKSVVVDLGTEATHISRVSRRVAGAPKTSPKNNNISTLKTSPTAVFRSALKSPINKGARKSETIKFDLSNLELNNKSVESPHALKRTFSKSDSESPDSRKIRLCYSDISSVSSDSKSPSPRHSGGGRQPSTISRRSTVSLRSFNAHNVSSGSLTNTRSNSVTQSRTRKSNVSIQILDNSIDKSFDNSIKDRFRRSSIKQKDSDLFSDSVIILPSKSNSFSNVSQASVTEKMTRGSRSMNDIQVVRKSTRSAEKTKENTPRKSRNAGIESLQKRASPRSPTKNGPSDRVKDYCVSPTKHISSNPKLSESLSKSQKSSSISLRRRTYSVEENDHGQVWNSSLSGRLITEGRDGSTDRSPSTPEGSGSMSNDASTPVLSLQHLLNTSNEKSSVKRVQDAIKHFESIGLPNTPEPTKRLTRRTLGAIGERIQRRMSEIAANSEEKSRTDPKKNSKLTRITKSNTRRSLSNINMASIKQILGRRQVSRGNKDDGSVASDATDENAPKPDNSLVITPKSTVKLLPEVVKEKHSTARKPFSKKSIIDNLNESQEIVKQLFSSPVKRKLSQSMNQLSASQLSDEEPNFYPSNRMTRRSKGTANVSFDFDSIKTPKVPAEMFVSPLDNSCKSSTLNDVIGKKLFEKNTPKNDLRHDGGVKNLLQSSPMQKSPLNDLTRVVNLKQILQKSDETRKSPKNDISNVAGMKRLLGTPKGKQKSPRNDLTNVAGIKKLLSSPTYQKSPKNDLTNVAGVKKMFKSPDSMQNSPVNDLTNVTGVKRLLGSPRGKQKSPINDLTNIRGIKEMLASPRVRKSPRNDLTNISSIKNLFGKNDELPPTSEIENSNVNKSRKVSVVEDISGVEELLNTSRSTAKEHEFSSRSEALFDKLVGRPQMRSYSRGRSLGRVKESGTKQTQNRSLPTGYNVGAWLKEIEMQSPISKKKETQVNKLNQSRKIPKELNNLTIDMVENDVVFDPNQRSIRRTTGRGGANISLPLKKRGLSSDGVSSGIFITDENDKSRSQYDINISLDELDVSTKSGKQSSKRRTENNASLPLKKRALLKKQDTSTPVKAKKPRDLVTIDLGPVSPISKLSLAHESTDLPENVPPPSADVITGGRSKDLQKNSQDDTSTNFSPKNKRSTRQKKQGNTTSESHTTMEVPSTRRGRSKKVVDNSKVEQKLTTRRAKKNETVDPLLEELTLPNSSIVSPKRLRLRRGIASVETAPAESPKVTRVVKGRKATKEIKDSEAKDITESSKGQQGRKREADDISHVNQDGENNSSKTLEGKVTTNRRKRGKQSKDEDLIVVQASPPKRSARGRKKVDYSALDTMESVDTSIVRNVVKPRRGRGTGNKGAADEGTPKTSAEDPKASESVIDEPAAGAVKTSGRGRRKKEPEIKVESPAQPANATKGRRGRKVVKSPLNTDVKKKVSDAGDNQVI